MTITSRQLEGSRAAVPAAAPGVSPANTQADGNETTAEASEAPAEAGETPAPLPCHRPEFLSLHDRLRQGNTAAAEELAEALLPWLLHSLLRKFSHTDEHLISDGVTIALCAYFGNPEIFDPRRGGSLELFLQGIARCKLGNLLRGEMRRKTTEAEAGKELCRYSVELCPWPENTLVEAELDVQQKFEKLVKTLATPLDRAFVALWHQGEWHTEPFAVLLGFADQPLKTQVKVVKQTKDRIIKRLRRELATWPQSEGAHLAAA